MVERLINEIRWNLSKKKTAEFSEADTIIVTLPKSGTTWLMVFLYSYFSAIDKREFTSSSPDFTRADIPKLIFTHDLFEHVTEPKLWARLRGRRLIPPLERRTKPILLTSRDPRDTTVSLYFELRKRGGRRKYRGDLRQMLEHPKFGIAMIVKIMNTWIKDWGGRPSFKLVRYEDCRANTEGTFREVLEFLGLKDIDESALAKSLAFSSFDNMKKMEATGRSNIPMFRSTNVGDPESFRVRRGIEGGYRAYLNSEEIRILDRAIELLDKRYGYS